MAVTVFVLMMLFLLRALAGTRPALFSFAQVLALPVLVWFAGWVAWDLWRAPALLAHRPPATPRSLLRFKGKYAAHAAASLALRLLAIGLILYWFIPI